MEELLYTIDSLRSEQDDSLVIKIQVAKKNNFLLTPLDIQPILTQDKLTALATSKDGTLIPFLIQEESAYLKKNKGIFLDRRLTPLNFIHISPKETLQALKLFAMTGKLYHQEKALVIDLYSRNEVYYTCETLNGIQKVETFLKSGDQEFPLSTCSLLVKGQPPFFIKGIQLKLIATDISWKDLKAAFQGKTRPIHELIEEAEEDEDAPRIHMKTPLIAEKTVEPLPLLVLTDRLGAFAELKMEYGSDQVVSFHDPNFPLARSIKRMPKLEAAWEKDLLETDFIRKPVGSSHYYCPLDKVAKSLAFLLEIGWHIRDNHNNRVLLQSNLDLSLETKDSHIFVKGKLHYQDFEANLSDIIGAFNRRERFAEIAPGHTALLPQSWEQTGLDWVIEEGDIIGDQICFKKNQIGPLAALLESQPQIRVEPDLQKLTERVRSFQGVRIKEPGPDFKGTLRSYQQDGLNWLDFLHDFGFHGLLADDMGLGKTVQVLAFLSTLKTDALSLIVVPTSLIFNWKKEIERFLPAFRTVVHHGNKRTVNLNDLTSAQIIITTYTTLRLDFSLLSQLSYSCLILDEAQAIKNARTQISQTVCRINSAFRLSMTGTPVENHLMELWSHFAFLMPDLFGEEKAFEAEMQAGASDPRFLRRIKRKIHPFLLRRKKDEVAKDLPEKIEQTVWVEMGEEQKKLYESFLTGVRKNLLTKVSMEGMGKHRMEVLEAIMRLRQICCHPFLVGTEETKESAKLDVLMQDLETIVEEGRKGLVYSQFTSMLGLIKTRIQEKGWNVVYLDGSTQNREKIVTQFQDDSSISLFLISLKAGGIGLNLTAADYVFLYDPWWNNAVENQAIDRAHRIGRIDTVIAKRYIMMESIEEKMMKLKAAKSMLATDLLDDHAAIQALTGDDLLFLLA